MKDVGYWVLQIPGRAQTIYLPIKGAAPTFLTSKEIANYEGVENSVWLRGFPTKWILSVHNSKPTHPGAAKIKLVIKSSRK
jgi:hypothetical protein